MAFTRFSALGIRPNPTAKTANFTATGDYGAYLVDATGGNITITINPAELWSNGLSGILFLTRTDGGANTVTIDPTGSATIDGGATTTIAASGKVAVYATSATALRTFLA